MYSYFHDRKAALGGKFLQIRLQLLIPQIRLQLFGQSENVLNPENLQPSKHMLKDLKRACELSLHCIGVCAYWNISGEI